MSASRTIQAVSLMLAAVSAQSAADKEKYALWTSTCDKWGFEWEPYEMETEDGWTVTMFRITKADGKDTRGGNGKPPVLMMHGAGMAAHSWLAGQNPLGPTLPGQLALEGYDVWMGNNRGTKYSNVNKNDDTWTLKEHWDFTWADMGKYDMPAFVDKVIEVTGKPKITIMGYSTGGAQMMYALATDQDYYAERTHRFVGLSACHYMRQNDDYEQQVSYFLKLDQLGVYNFYGPDESALDAATCKEYGIMPGIECDSIGLSDGSVAISYKVMQYYAQIAVEHRFQEPQSLEKWASGDRFTQEVEMSRIDRVPVSLVHSVSDETCDPVMIEWTYAQIQSPDKHLIFEHGGHSLYAYEIKQSFVNRIMATIDTGATDFAVSAQAGVASMAMLLLATLF